MDLKKFNKIPNTNNTINKILSEIIFKKNFLIKSSL